MTSRFPNQLKYLLLQVRKPDDPMRSHEVRSFARTLEAGADQFRVLDLLTAAISTADLAAVDVVLVGGSGHYSATDNAEWLDRALDSLRTVHDVGKPTFASCWGFQAIARALGGEVEHDASRAEVGTHHIRLTADGASDPIFSECGPSFDVQMGHEDHVTKLPPNVTLLATSERSQNQAYRFNDRPIYCTQFHSELSADDIIQRVTAYPEYLHELTGLTLDEFTSSLRDTPDAAAILRRFVRVFA